MNGPRRGFSLIEMLAVLGCTSVLLTLAVASLHTLFQTERASRRDWSEVATLERMGAAFRRDVHQATKAPEVLDASRMIITLNEKTSVEYRVEDGRVVVARRGESTRAETFTFQRWRPARFERSEEMGRVLTRLVFQPAERPESIDRAIEAVAGPFQNGGNTR